MWVDPRFRLMEVTPLPMASKAVEVEVESPSTAPAPSPGSAPSKLETVPTEVGLVLDTPCSIMRDAIRIRPGVGGKGEEVLCAPAPISLRYYLLRTLWSSTDSRLENLRNVCPQLSLR